MIVALAVYLAIFAALAIANVSELRIHAKNWWTLGLEVTLVLAGTVL